MIIESYIVYILTNQEADLKQKKPLPRKARFNTATTKSLGFTS